MRVGVVSAEYSGVTAYTGGIGTHFRALCEGLVTAGDSVSVLLLGDGVAPGESLNGVRIRMVGSGSRGRVRAVRPLQLSIHARAHASCLRRSDVIIAPEWGGWACSIARSTSLPPVVTNLATSLRQVRSIEPIPLRRISLRSRDAVQARLERAQTLASVGIFAISQPILDWAHDIWPIDSIPSTVVPNFLAQRDPAFRLKSERAAGHIVFTGRLSVWKGVDVLTRAMLLCWTRDPSLQLFFYGSEGEIAGKSASDYLKGIAGKYSANLHFMGHGSPGAVRSALANAEMAVFPSLFEGFGMGALEALQVGTPTIATSGSGFESFCISGKNSILVPPGEVEALADAIMGVHENAKLRDAIGRAGAIAAQRFSSDQVIPELRRFLAEVA